MSEAVITPRTVRSHAGAAFLCQALQTLGAPFDPTSDPSRPRVEVLVAGCGMGHEAAYLQQELHARVVAVDSELVPSDQFADWPDLTFQEASVLDLPFDDARFDLVFCHHVIEHVSDPPRGLAELARVMRPSGRLFIGTPNRYRLLSAVGAYAQRDWQSTFWAKLGENVSDWGLRLTGRFRNELGAHAGFSRGELDRMLARHFDDRCWLTAPYLRFKYATGGWRMPVALLARRPFLGLAAPSIYALCGKQVEESDPCSALTAS